MKIIEHIYYNYENSKNTFEFVCFIFWLDLHIVLYAGLLIVKFLEYRNLEKSFEFTVLYFLISLVYEFIIFAIFQITKELIRNNLKIWKIMNKIKNKEGKNEA